MPRAILLLLAVVLTAGPALGSERAEAPQQPDVAAVPSCVACEVPVADPRELFPRDEWKALRRGDVLHSESSNGNGSGGESRAEVLIPFSPAQVWAVLTDFERWPSFMPLIRGTRISRRESGRMWVRQDYRVVFADLKHTSIYDLEPASGSLRWVLDLEQDHDIAASQGSWSLIPVADGEQTVIRYHAEMDAGRAVPGFVQKLLRKRSLEGLLSSLRREVARRFGVSASD